MNVVDPLGLEGKAHEGAVVNVRRDGDWTVRGEGAPSVTAKKVNSSTGEAVDVPVYGVVEREQVKKSPEMTPEQKQELAKRVTQGYLDLGCIATMANPLAGGVCIGAVHGEDVANWLSGQ